MPHRQIFPIVLEDCLSKKNQHPSAESIGRRIHVVDHADPAHASLLTMHAGFRLMVYGRPYADSSRRSTTGRSRSSQRYVQLGMVEMESVTTMILA